MHAYDLLPVVRILTGITRTNRIGRLLGSAIIAVLELARVEEVERVRDMERMGAGSAEQLYP